MIISSLLDTDLYKFTMMQVVFHRFRDANVEYQFVCRTSGINLCDLEQQLISEVKHLCSLKLSDDELAYLTKLNLFKEDFLLFLRDFSLDINHIEIFTDEQLQVHIRGPWLHTILFEVPLLAMVSEIYSRTYFPDETFQIGRSRLNEKIRFVKEHSQKNEFLFSDFGTRRRYSLAWHKEVLRKLSDELATNLRGTSNIMLAREFSLQPVGTMAHEFIQACQALAPDLRSSQRYAFQTWLNEYDSALGIILSDTYTLPVFLSDFAEFFAKRFHGVRHDSGDPIKWGHAILDHYVKLGITTEDKTLVFSDALTFQKALAIHNEFFPRIRTVFGIGTHLTNDVGAPRMDIVIKMVTCNGQPVAKISDEPHKSICIDPHYLQQLKKTFGIP